MSLQIRAVGTDNNTNREGPCPKHFPKQGKYVMDDGRKRAVYSPCLGNQNGQVSKRPKGAVCKTEV